MSLPLNSGHLGEYELFTYGDELGGDVWKAKISAREFEPDEILRAREVALNKLLSDKIDTREKLGWYKFLLP